MRPFIEALGLSAPATLKHIYYEELRLEEYPGSWWLATECYYHKTEFGKEEWLKLDGRNCEKMFEESRTLQLVPFSRERFIFLCFNPRFYLNIHSLQKTY